LNGLHKAAAKAKDKENLFVNESDFPDIVEQKTEIRLIEGEQRVVLCLSLSSKGELAAYKAEIRRILKLSSFEYTKVPFACDGMLFVTHQGEWRGVSCGAQEHGLRQCAENMAQNKLDKGGVSVPLAGASGHGA
jgi:hypothetical protein